MALIVPVALVLMFTAFVPVKFVITFMSYRVWLFDSVKIYPIFVIQKLLLIYFSFSIKKITSHYPNGHPNGLCNHTGK